MNIKTIALSLLIILLSGCAAGTAGMHRANVDIYANLILELSPTEEDTADEARRRLFLLADVSRVN